MEGISVETGRLDHDVHTAAAALFQHFGLMKAAHQVLLDFHLGENTLSPTPYSLSKLLCLCRDSTWGIVISDYKGTRLQRNRTPVV